MEDRSPRRVGVQLDGALELAEHVDQVLRAWQIETADDSPVLITVPVRSSVRAAPVRVAGQRVIILMEGGDAGGARSALSQGADAVLAVADVESLLAPAIHAVQAGLVVVSPRFSAALQAPALTPREKQVLALVVMGFTNSEIAAQLIVAESTVKSHLFTAFKRLGVRTRTEAVALITDPDRGLGSGILSIPHGR